MKSVKMRELKLAILATMATFSAAAFSVCAVGDSITEGGAAFTAHRVALEAEFAARGWNVEWKGSHTKAGSGSANRCEGYSGNSAYEIASKYIANAEKTPADIAADILLLHAGHNYNCGDANLTPAVRPTAEIVAEATNAHARIIAKARELNPDVIVLYAQVISSGGDREVKYSYITNGLNQAIAVGLISALLTCVILGGIGYAAWPYMPYIEEIITWRELAITAACVFVFGFVIMVFCTLLSVNKYLRMKARELYKI